MYMWTHRGDFQIHHCCDVIMGAMASQVTSPPIFYSTVHSGADQRKHQSSASLNFVWGIHRWPVNSPHKSPVTRKIISFDEVITLYNFTVRWCHMNVMLSQIVCHSTVCLTVYADPHQRNNKVRITGPLWKEFSGERWIPHTKDH